MTARQSHHLTAIETILARSSLKNRLGLLLTLALLLGVFGAGLASGAWVACLRAPVPWYTGELFEAAVGERRAVWRGLELHLGVADRYAIKRSQIAEATAFIAARVDSAGRRLQIDSGAVAARQLDHQLSPAHSLR